MNAHSNDPGVNVDNPSSCGKVELPGMLLPSRQVEATADNDDDNGEEGQLQRADRNDQNDSCSQEARSTAYRCGRGEAADADGSSPTAHDLGGVIDDGGRATIGGVWGTSLADLEINNSESGHHLSLSSRGAGAADGSAAAAVAGTLRTASTATTASGTAGSSSLSSAATSVVVGRAPKLLDFFDSDDEGSRSDFREATLYVEKFREFDLDRAILEKGLGATGECLAALNLPLVARYTFQVIESRQVNRGRFLSRGLRFSFLNCLGAQCAANRLPQEPGFGCSSPYYTALCRVNTATLHFLPGAFFARDSLANDSTNLHT